MTNPERLDFRGNDKTLQSLEKSWCVTDIMLSCLLKITSLKAWLVTSWSARADFKSLVKNAQGDILSIIYTNLFLFGLTDGVRVAAGVGQWAKKSPGNITRLYKKKNIHCNIQLWAIKTLQIISAACFFATGDTEKLQREHENCTDTCKPFLH